jgi:hypothetical protein
MMFAAPIASMLCFGDDHVEVGCHSDPADPCEKSSDEPAPHSDHDPCIDIAAAPASLTRVLVNLDSFDHAWLAVLPLLVADTIASPTRPAGDLADESPPRFGARAFATTISPRT